MSDKTYAERFGTPSRPDGCPVLIAAALTKVETENAALRELLDKVQKSHFTLSKDNAALREALEIEQERSLYWRNIANRKEAQP